MSIVDDVKSRLDIVDVVSDYVTLQKAGRNFKAPCPFHTEKTPSFIVNPERQSWRCFGSCSTGGDAIGFVMKKENLSFGDVLRRLAEKVGIQVVETPKAVLDKRDRLYQVNQEAARFYQEYLESPEGRAAMQYLAERGVNEKARKDFQIGLSPRGGRKTLKEHLASLGFEQDIAIEAGALRKDDESGAVRDFFYGRLMFPIHDKDGRVAGFGARTLDGSQPKYLNTPATAIFDKRSTLYGLHKAVNAIRAKETAVIVEGYMDAIAAHQHSYANVVASMGTALTENQMALLRPLTKKIVQALDQDAAGQEATLRSLETVHRAMERRGLGQRVQTEILIATITEGKDPDDLIRRNPKEWERVTREAVPFMDFLIPAMARRHDDSTPEGKAKAAEALGPVIFSMRNAFEQERYFSLLARTLGVSHDALEAAIGRPGGGGRNSRNRRSGPAAAPATVFGASGRDVLEEYVLALLLTWPDLKEQAVEHTPEEFTRPENREVFTVFMGCNTMEEVSLKLDPTLHDHLARLGQINVEPADRRTSELAIKQTLRRIQQRFLQEHQAELLEAVDSSSPLSKELEETIVKIDSRLKQNYLQK